MSHVNARFSVLSVTQKLLFFGTLAVICASFIAFVFIKTLNAAAPTGFTSQEYQDANGDGQVDQVVIVINGGEALTTCDVSDAEVATDWTWDGGISILGLLETTGNTHTCDLGTATITLKLKSTAVGLTGHGVAPTIAYDNDDADNSIVNASGTLGNVAAANVADGAAPRVKSISTIDIGANGSTPNGKVDHLQVTFTETIDDSAITNYSAGTDYIPTTLAVANVTNEKILATENICPLDNGEDDDDLCIIFDEDPGTCDITSQAGCDTSAVDQDVTWTGASVNIQDPSGNVMGDLTSGAITEVDGARPHFLGSMYKDGSANGTIDLFEVYFSEPASYTYQDSDWTATPNSLTGFDVTGCPLICSNQSIFQMDATANAGITGGTTQPTIAYTAGNNITDAAGNNAANISATAVIDGAAPAILTSNFSDANSDGKVDRHVLTFSENTLFTFAGTDWAYTTAGDVGLTGDFAAAECTGGGTKTITCTDVGTGTMDATAARTGKQTSGGADPRWAYTNNSNNVKDSANNALSTNTVTLADNAAPVIVSTFPVDNAVNGTITDLPTITFSERMDTGVFAFTTGIAPLGGYTNTWDTNKTIVTFNHASNFTKGVKYDITVTVAADDANSLGFSGAIVANPFDFTIAPGGSSGGGGGGSSTLTSAFTINDGATETISPTVVLKPTVTGGTEMLFSNNPSFTGAKWEPYTDTKVWTLEDGLGTKKVYALFRAGASQSNAPVTQAINVVQTVSQPVFADRSTITSNKTFAEANNIEEVTVEVTALDTTGKAVEGKSVILKSSRDSQDIITPSNSTTNASGKAIFMVKSASPGVSTLMAVVDNASINATVAVEFKAKDANPVGDIIPPQGINVGDLIKSTESSAVYHYGADGKRHAFPNETVFNTYYANFNSLKTISTAQLAGIALGKNVKIRPGTWLMKIQSDPKVYAVTPGGTLRWVKTESVAKALYGDTWNTKIIDIDVTFFNDYVIGTEIATNIHPDGAMFKHAGSVNKYYVINGTQRRFASEAAFAENNMMAKFVHTVSDTITYPNGADILGKEASVSKVLY